MSAVYSDLSICTMSAVYSDLYYVSRLFRSVLCEQSIEICTVRRLLRSVLSVCTMLAVYSDLSVCTMPAVYSDLHYVSSLLRSVLCTMSAVY